MITSKELLARLAKQSGCTQAAVKNILDALGDLVALELTESADAKIVLPGLGRFSSKIRAARTGRHPQTGVSLMIPAQRVPAFAFAGKLKDKISAGKKRTTNSSKKGKKR